MQELSRQKDHSRQGLKRNTNARVKQTAGSLQARPRRVAQACWCTATKKERGGGGLGVFTPRQVWQCAFQKGLL
eukprot:1160788-Pelagomonas_calceolata.AAC.4